MFGRLCLGIPISRQLESHSLPQDPASGSHQFPRVLRVLDPAGHFIQIGQFSSAEDAAAFARAADRTDPLEQFFGIAGGKFLRRCDFGDDQQLCIVAAEHGNSTNELGLLLPLRYHVAIDAAMIEFRSNSIGIRGEQVIDGVDLDRFESLCHPRAD